MVVVVVTTMVIKKDCSQRHMLSVLFVQCGIVPVLHR